MKLRVSCYKPFELKFSNLLQSIIIFDWRFELNKFLTIWKISTARVLGERCLKESIKTSKGRIRNKLIISEWLNGIKSSAKNMVEQVDISVTLLQNSIEAKIRGNIVDANGTLIGSAKSLASGVPASYQRAWWKPS